MEWIEITDGYFDRNLPIYGIRLDVDNNSCNANESALYFAISPNIYADNIAWYNCSGSTYAYAGANRVNMAWYNQFCHYNPSSESYYVEDRKFSSCTLVSGTTYEYMYDYTPLYFAGGYATQNSLSCHGIWVLVDTGAFEVDVDAISAPYSGSAYTVNLTSDNTWTATTEQSWISVSPSTGLTNAALTVTISANGGLQRSGVITLTDSQSNSITITVYQAKASLSLKSCSVARSGNVVNKMYREGQLILLNVARKPYLDLSTNELDFQSGASSTTVMINSNMTWTASTSTPWITVTTGSSTLNVAVSENETGDERNGSITITGRNMLSSITTSITVNQEYVVDYSKRYLTMRSLSNNNSITFTKKSAVTTTYATSISYSTDNGATWTTTNVNSSQQTVTVSGLNNGDEVLWKGTANSWSKTGSSGLTALCSTFSSTGDYEIEGNVMSLLYGDNFSGQTSITGENALMFLFYNSTYLTNAYNLVLPATTLSVRCYRSLLQGCSKLVTPMKELPAMTLTESCYQGMFDTCSAMTSVPVLPATTLASSCYNNMFLRCKKITASPVLPAKTLVSDCYRAMFNNCSVLKHIICLAETGIGQNNSTLGWTTSVPTSSDGLFEYANGVTSWSRGTAGVPNNWQLRVYNP